MININNYEIFKSNLSTLKEISKDDSEAVVEYMTESILPIVNFDGVKTEYFKSLHLSDEEAKSCDGLLCLNNKDIFIEFKNEIKNKGIFILVYNDNKNPITKQQIKQKDIEEASSSQYIKQYIFKKSGKEFIRYGLEKFEKYFNKVHTYCQEDFEKYIKQFEI